MKQMNVWQDEFETDELDPKAPETRTDPVPGGDGIPKIEISTSSPADNLTQPLQQPQQPQRQQSVNFTPTPTNGTHASTHSHAHPPTSDPTSTQADPKTYLLNSYTRSKIHDCLCYPS